MTPNEAAGLPEPPEVLSFVQWAVKNERVTSFDVESHKVFTRFPFSSVDSTNIGRNIGIDQAWRGTYQPATKEARAAVMRGRIEAHNAPARWDFMPVEPEQPQQGALL